ncbi:hypothetical protein J5N97_010868 [Dioscorea zingiberensis]|uniref:Uncharacterized protein n=1 Tax=Dioscorea zingiberensis TaxID=325984 RepID=A0A9D5D1X0_9LILI|nr:hypothetical protein J5N97_010868 [Dioscorea zingiberensis]
MGWKWVDEPSDSLPSSRGLGSAGELTNPNPRSVEDRCGMRKIVSSNCRTEEVEPGRFIRKCENKEQIFRDCVGRPTEVETRTEFTEDDITDKIKSGVIPFGTSNAEPFNFPGLLDDMEAIQRGLLHGFTNVLDAADKMANEFFNSFGFPSSHDREPSPFGQGRQEGREIKIDVPKNDKFPRNLENFGDIREV